MGIIEPLIRTVCILVAIVTWYGPEQTNGEPFVAAYWHGELPEGAPAIVDYEYFGVATASREIPFGTRIRFTVLNTVREEDYSIVGNTVVATVVDRLSDEGGAVEFDLWPAAFLKLTGDLDIGIVYIKAEILHRTLEYGIERKHWELAAWR